MSAFVRAQRDLYKAPRALGDLNAAQRGPDVILKRLVRRAATRKAFSLLRKTGLR